MGCMAAYAAEHEYLPLVEEGKSWHYKFGKTDRFDSSLTMRGDTLIEGKTYKKVFFSDSVAYDMQWPIAYMCEENKVVTAKSNRAAIEWLSEISKSHDYREFNFIDEYAKYNFNDFSAPDYTIPDNIMTANDSCYMTRLEDSYDGTARNVAEWARVDYEYSAAEMKYWVIEGVGIEGSCVHLLKTSMRPLSWINSGRSFLGYLAYVTNAQGEVIYTGRTLRDSQSGVQDVAGSASVVAEEYYSVNGMKLASPSSGIVIKLTRYSDGSAKASKHILR